MGSPTAEWEFPGDSAFGARATNDTAPASGSAPGTVVALGDTSADNPPSMDNPVVAMTFGSPYDGVRFDNDLWAGENSALFSYSDRTVPAGGSITISWSYATAASTASMEEARSDAAAARAALTASKRSAARLSDVKLQRRRVTSKLKLSFRLSRSANVRLVLQARPGTHGAFKQLAVATTHGRQGKNSLAVGSRWRKQLVPHRTARILVQLRALHNWVTKKTLKLTVR